MATAIKKMQEIESLLMIGVSYENQFGPKFKQHDAFLLQLILKGLQPAYEVSKIPIMVCVLFSWKKTIGAMEK